MIGTMRLYLALLCCVTCVISISDHPAPRIVIVGAGSAGIAAASRLFENGFSDVTILEAENYIGGRVRSVEFGEYMVDLGGQWVHGEKNNVAFELAWPLGLIERFNENHNMTIKFFGSSGLSLSPETSLGLRYFQASLLEGLTNIDSLKTGTFGEYADAKYDDYIKSHPEISADLHEPLRHSINLAQMGSDGADSWYDVSAKSLRDYAECDGDQLINWKNRTYSTILDILMRKFPDPQQELPVLNHTRTSSRVIEINYMNRSIPIKVLTENKDEYLADHVIFTGSLGVLKANYKELFNPPLPEKKILSIKNLGFGHVAKIWLYYDNPWWYSDKDKYNIKAIYWTEADKKKIENDPLRKWMLGIFGLVPVEHKPKLLCMWISTNHSIEMETITEELIRNQTSELIHRFFGNEYNISEPSKIRRTLWNTNKNFRGTYSYQYVGKDSANITNADLAEPIIYNAKPILLFAGEASSEHYSTVHGAIESGWREADRIINLYSTKTFNEN